MSAVAVVKYASKSFTLPNTSIRLRSIIDDPNADIRDMANEISFDPSLCAKVLKLANSSLFRFPTEVTSIDKALNVIGGEAAYNIAMAETANRAFKAFQSAQIEFDSFWQKSICNGLIAKGIAQQKQIRGSERFFILGIMQNLSELVCATKLPDKYEKYINSLETEAQTKQSSLLPADLQQAHFGFTFSCCSGHILEAYGLPDMLWQALKEMSVEEQKQTSTDASILYAAQSLQYLQEGEALFSHDGVNKMKINDLGLSAAEYDIINTHAHSEAIKIAASIQ